MARDLTYITTLFGKAYNVAKQADKNKNLMQIEFFKAADEVLEEESRPHKSVVVPEGEDVGDYVKRFYPGWRIFRVEDSRAEIERDPSLMRYTFVNEEDGMVYGRDTVESGPSLDEERLIAEDPDLWQQISQLTREVKDPSTWTPEQMERAERFFIPGAVKTKLRPPRQAKPEELAELND